MSISDTITSIETHLQADYEGLENIGADLTGINKNILNIRTILDTIYNDMPKVTGEGTEVTLTPTRKGRLALIPKGNSTQESTTGKNKYYSGNGFAPTTIGWFGQDGINVTYADGLLNDPYYYDLIGGQSYTFSVKTATNIEGIQLVFLNNNTVDLISSINTSGSTIITPNANRRAWVRFKNASTNAYTFLEGQFENGSTATDFEQYTGGNPAPSPSFPFPIRNVTGNNNVVLRGKNRLNASQESYTLEKDVSNRVEIGTIEMIANTKYYITYNIDTATISSLRNTPQITLNNTDYYEDTNSNHNTTTGRKTWEFRPTVSGTATVKYWLNQANVNVTISKVMVSTSSDTTYEPYVTPQTKPLNLGNIELNKIGNYQDYIYKNNNKWYKKEQVGKKVLDDTENWTQNVQNEAFVISDLSPSYMVTNEYNILSNYYLGVKNITEYSQLSNNQIALLNSSTNNRLIIKDNRFTGMTAFKNWIHDNNVTIYYALATPTDIEITDTTLISQLEAIDKVNSYSGTTIITSTFDSNNAQMILSASGLKGE